MDYSATPLKNKKRTSSYEDIERKLENQLRNHMVKQMVLNTNFCLNFKIFFQFIVYFFIYSVNYVTGNIPNLEDKLTEKKSIPPKKVSLSQY